MIKDNCNCNEHTCQEPKVYPFAGIDFTAEEINSLLKSIQNKVNRGEIVDGLSAYKVAVANGYQGTEEQWLESLRGPRGNAFDYNDFTPEQIEHFTRPAVQAGEKVLNDSEIVLSGVKSNSEQSIKEVTTRANESIASSNAASQAAVENSKTHWYPRVDSSGDLTWSRSPTNTPPNPTNIKGPAGKDGLTGSTEDIIVVKDFNGDGDTPAKSYVLGAEVGPKIQENIEETKLHKKNTGLYRVSQFHSHTGFWEVVPYDAEAQTFLTASTYNKGDKVNVPNVPNKTFRATKTLQGIIPDINTISNKFTLEEAVYFVPDEYHSDGMEIAFISSENNQPVIYRFAGGVFTDKKNWKDDVYDKLYELGEKVPHNVFIPTDNYQLNFLIPEIYVSDIKNIFDVIGSKVRIVVLRNYYNIEKDAYLTGVYIRKDNKEYKMYRIFSVSYYGTKEKALEASKQYISDSPIIKSDLYPIYLKLNWECIPEDKENIFDNVIISGSVYSKEYSTSILQMMQAVSQVVGNNQQHVQSELSFAKLTGLASIQEYYPDKYYRKGELVLFNGKPYEMLEGYSGVFDLSKVKDTGLREALTSLILDINANLGINNQILQVSKYTKNVQFKFPLVKGCRITAEIHNAHVGEHVSVFSKYIDGNPDKWICQLDTENQKAVFVWNYEDDKTLGIAYPEGTSEDTYVSFSSSLFANELIESSSNKEDSEFIHSICDKNHNVIFGVYKNGEVYNNCFSVNEKKILDKIEQNRKNDSLKRHKISSELSKRKLLFVEDFDNDTLDEAVWEIKKDVDFNKSCTFLADNLSIKDSVLDMVIKREEKIHSDDSEGNPINEKTLFTSSLIQTKFGILKGRLEFKAKFVVTKGMWPGLWISSLFGHYRELKGLNEIDLMENWGRDESFFTCHYTLSDFEFNHSAVRYDELSQWRIYALELSGDTFEFFIDDTLITSGKLSDLNWGNGDGSQNPFTIVLDIFPTGTELASEGHMYVDWVKFYAPKDNPVKCTANQDDITLRAITSDNIGVNMGNEYTLTLSEVVDKLKGIYPSFSDNVNVLNGYFSSDNDSVIEITNAHRGWLNVKSTGVANISYNYISGIKKSVKVNII